MNKNTKIVLLVSIICLIILLVVGGTYAFFGWQSDTSLIDVTVSSGTGTCEGLSDNNLEFEPVSSKENGRIIKLKANQKMGSKSYITWEMIINSISGLQDQSFKYELVNITTGVSYGTGNFQNITALAGSNTITFSNNSEKLSYNTDYIFALYLWIDGQNFNNPLTMAAQEIDFDISCNIIGTE